MSKRLKLDRGVHPLVHDLAVDLHKGRIDRRHFLGTTTLLGLSATSAYALLSRQTAASNKVRNYELQPTLYHQFNKVWIDA